MKKKKLCGLLFVGALAAVTAGASFLVNPTVEASAADAIVMSTPDTRFEMTGAAIRYDNPTGLRFEALVGVDLATDEAVEFGVIIFPKNIMEMYEISTEYSATTDYHTEITTKAAEYVAQYPLMDMTAEPQAVYAKEDTEKTTPIYYTLWGSITDIQYANLSRDWWGVAYAKEGDKYTYAEFAHDVNVRNVVYVASAAASDTAFGYTESQMDTMKGFVSKAMYRLDEPAKTEEEANELVASKEWATFTAALSNESLELQKDASQKLSVSAKGLTLGATWATSDNQVATVDKYGVVTALNYGEATITANCMGQTLECTVTVAKPAEFTYVPANVYGLGNYATYTVPMATASNGATVTWIAEEYIAKNTMTTQIGDSLLGPWNSEEHTQVQLSYDDFDLIRITYTLTLGDYTEKAYTFLCRGGKPLMEVYGDFVSDMTTTGDMSVSDYELIDGEGGSIRLYNGTGNTFGNLSFPANMYLGDNTTAFSFYIYNASNEPVTLVDPWGTPDSWNVVIPAKSMIYDGWVTQFAAGGSLAWISTNNALTNFNVKATSAGVVDLYIGAFNVNSDAFDVGSLVLNGSESDDVATVTFNKVANASNYTYTVVANSNEVDDYIDKVVEPAVDGVYTITYDYKDIVEDLAELEIIVTAHGANGAAKTASYKKNFFEFTSVPANVFVTITEDYTLQLPTYTKGELTWVLEVYDNRMMYGEHTANGGDGSVGSAVLLRYENPTTLRFPHEHYGAKATWTLTLGAYSIQAYTIYSPLEIERSSIVPVEPSATYFSSGTANGDLQETDTSIISGTQGWLRLYNGTNSTYGSYTVGENISIGADWTPFSYYIYNNSDSVVEVNIAGGNGGTMKIQPHTAMHMNFNVYTALYLGTAWNLVDGTTGYLKDFSFTATSADGVVDLYIGALRVGVSNL